MKHITVLLHEAVDALALTPASVVVDATLGAGGHSTEIASRLGKSGVLIAIDADQIAVDAFMPQTKATVIKVCDNFSNITDILATHEITAVDAVLADLGWRTDQFLEEGRGFSFNDDTALVMTYGQTDQYLFTAYNVVNEWAEESLADVIYGYGEEKLARKIAKAIVTARAESPIVTAKQLANVITSAVGASYRRLRIHPATRTFQALRIVVNDELARLDSFITDAFALLCPGGRLAIISFHSLEDRIVKHRFRSFAHDQVGTLVTKRPIVPLQEEIIINPRARSAKLRVIQKITT
jgi:16S rRNA (cytosine1402-N4)-methyltransferase